MLFSPKALLCVTAASVVFLFFRQASLLQKFKEVTLYVLGLLMPVAALGAFFFYKKELNELIQWTFIRNITYPDIRSSVFLLYPQNLVFFLLAFSGMIVWFLQKKILRHPVSLFLEIGVVLFCLVVFAMPGTFAQAGLMFVPIFSVAAAIALRASFQSSSKLFKTFTLIAGLIVPFVSILIARPFERTNQDQFAVMTWILQNTSENEKIFDGNTAYIFRPQAYYYGSLVDAIRYQIARGLIQASIPDNLRLNRCRVVIFDDRVADLPNPVQAFIRANYLPAEKQSIYLAGKNLGPENFSGKYATFRIEIPAIYRIETNPKEFRIDRMPYNQPLLLNAGSHRIEADEEIRFVKIVAMKEK
jgi:hypothetical protein